MVRPDPPPEKRPFGHVLRDVLAADNRCDLAVMVRDRLHVLLVDGDKEITAESSTAALRKEKASLQDILDNPTTMKRLIIREIESDAKTFGDPRRTLIEGGMQPDKVARVVGLAASVPFDKANPAAASNRRIRSDIRSNGVCSGPLLGRAGGTILGITIVSSSVVWVRWAEALRMR